MSEQNMSTVLDDMEQVYRNHRRHDVTSTLTTLMIDGISAHAMLLDSFVVLHAAFISSLHRLIGVEFAAFVVQNVVSAYERHLRDYESDVSDVTTRPEEGGKECSNLIVLLSELYNFQVISCILLYDIIKDLLGKTLSEFRVELLLKILRSKQGVEPFPSSVHVHRFRAATPAR
jgi:nucleolar MIF4G domain-containing protein 1